jgi:predicted metal-dependent hydrolase
LVTGTARRVAGGLRARRKEPLPDEPRLAQLPGGPLAYTLRHSLRARRLRVVVDPERGVVVTVPAGRAARASATVAHVVDGFLAEREPWLRRHLERQAQANARIAARRPFEPGGTVLYFGQLHRLLVEPAGAGLRRSSVVRVGADDGDDIVVLMAPADRRPARRVLETWLRERSRVTIEARLLEHAAVLGVRPTGVSIRDQRTRWGSATRTRHLSFSWRLILAPPEALDTVVVHELAHLRVFGHGPAFWELVASRRPDHVRWRRWLREHALELHAALGPIDGEVAAAS